MRTIRLGVLAAVAVVVCGAGYVYRGEVARLLGFGTSAKAAEQAAGSPAAMAQPPGRRGRANPGGPVPVVVAKIAQKPMPIIVDAVGTVQAIASIQIKPRTDSQIMKVHVEEGALVKEGDLLFELDARTLRAQLGQIDAQIRKAQAQLVQARRDLQRFEDLLGKNAGTVVQRDSALTAVKAAEAQLEADEAAKASVQTLLTYTEIRAPVSGRIGSIASKAGAVVRVGDNSANSTLATINQIDPIFVTFAIPQVILPDLRAAMAKGPVAVNAIVEQTKKPPGAMAFIENTVDPNTGTVTAKAQQGEPFDERLALVMPKRTMHDRHPEVAFPQALFDGKIPRVRHRGIAHRHDVTVRKEKSITLRPLGVFRVVFENMEIQRGENIRHTQRPREMAGLRRGEHLNDGLADRQCVTFHLFHLCVGHR